MLAVPEVAGSTPSWSSDVSADPPEVGQAGERDPGDLAGQTSILAQGGHLGSGCHLDLLRGTLKYEGCTCLYVHQAVVKLLLYKCPQPT